MIIAINAHKSKQVTKVADEIYTQLSDNNIEVLLDDRDGYRPGVKFADSELLGIPYRIVIGDRGLAKDVVEVTERRSGDINDVALNDVAEKLTGLVQQDLNQ